MGVVMYISADGAQESVLEIVKGKDAGTSVDSTDVLKAGQIYTETPSGRMRLMDYFNGVERRIASELANRKADIASVRAQMARDFAFNAAARAKLKRQMLHKMAVNAKTCRDNLNSAMRKTQERFAKQARKDLEGAMHSWDHKIANFRRDSKAARSRLSAQFAAQDKATRAWANNKIKGLVASTAAQFNDVETKMAKNRHEVDMALRKATMRFEAALNAEKALEDKRYAQTVANIAAAKREASEKIAAATSEFKVQLLQLSSTVKQQVSKVNNRIDHTAGVVRSDAAAQAKVNANVNAEMGRMIALGNKRYKHQLKKDAELQNLIAKDKAATDRKLNKMTASFNDALSKIRSTLKKDRAHAEKRLNESTNS